VAVKSNPQNEEMASQLFMSLVRLKQYGNFDISFFSPFPLDLHIPRYSHHVV